MIHLERDILDFLFLGIMETKIVLIRIQLFENFSYTRERVVPTKYIRKFECSG